MENEEGASLIQISQKDKVKGFYALLTNGSVRCLPNQKYVVPKYCLDILNQKKINYELLKPKRK